MPAMPGFALSLPVPATPGAQARGYLNNAI
jgi:hypothetical protein